MNQKSFPLINRGMNRDLSVSKAGESSAYENHNIRILARDHDTLMSITNERGNKEIPLDDLDGNLLGWNVLNNHIILFCHDSAKRDTIYRVDYDGDSFELVKLFNGELRLDMEYPIESVVYYETENIQKIYWVDGKNVLRFMNFMATEDERAKWDVTSFDSNRAADFSVTVEIEKDNSGSTRQNGVAQYLLTYFNKHGQETGYVWISDLVYLSPIDHGGAADGTNNNLVKLSLKNLDQSYTHFRVYLVFRSSWNGTPVAYRVAEQAIVSDIATVIDDGAHLTAVDASSLLYLGSQPLIAGTLTHKDQTLFLGDLKSIGRGNYDRLEQAIRNNMFILNDGEFVEGETWEAKDECVQFIYSDESSQNIGNIPYVENAGLYNYKNQLIYTSSQITTFKGGEKYRFALKFKLKDGKETDAFWIGDKENSLYPVIVKGGKSIRRVVVRCTIPQQVMQAISEYDDVVFSTVQLMIAEASSADRSVKAQGVVSPTMFSPWERYNGRTYSFPSWIARVRGSNYAWKHFQPVAKSNTSAGEIQCCYWKGDNPQNPFYQYKNYKASASDSIGYVEEFPTNGGFNYISIIGVMRLRTAHWNPIPAWQYGFDMRIDVILGTKYDESSSYDTAIRKFSFEDNYSDFAISDSSLSEGSSRTFYGTETVEEETVTKYTIEYISLPKLYTASWYSWNAAKNSMYQNIQEQMISVGLENYIPSRASFDKVFDSAAHDNYGDTIMVNFIFPDVIGKPNTDSMWDVLDNKNGGADPSPNRWRELGDTNVSGTYGGKLPAYYKKNIMFVDENVVTLNSPEIEYGTASFDNAEYKFRIVGVAKMSSVQSDYTVNAIQGDIPGESLERYSFSRRIDSSKYNADGIISWALWKDHSLDKSEECKQDDIEKRTSSDYVKGNAIVRYWLYMWQQAGRISGYTGEDEKAEFSKLESKTFANLHFAYNTIYLNTAKNMDIETIRMVDDVSKVDYGIKVDGDSMYYNGIVQLPLTTPNTMKYPIFYSKGNQSDTDNIITASDNKEENNLDAYLYSVSPVVLDYVAGSHAVISMKTEKVNREGKYCQTILPAFFDSEKLDYSGYKTGETTGALLSWDKSDENIPTLLGLDDSLSQPTFVQVGDFDEENMLVSLKYTGTSGSWFTAWQKAISDYPDRRIFCFVVTSTHRYMVEIDGVTTDSGDVVLNRASVICSYKLDGTKTIGEPEMSVSYIYMPTVSSVVKRGFTYANVPNNSVSGTEIYPFHDYAVEQPSLAFTPNDEMNAEYLHDGDKYLFIGEIYDDFANGDTRYGGIDMSSIESNRFITAGPQFVIDNEDGTQAVTIYGDQGDTYFQRWDGLKTKPSSKDALNGVIDITSVMLETHINLDGRTDLMRGITEIASIDTGLYGKINPVYSQPNNFVVRRDLDEDFNLDEYRSSVTWTFEKSDSAMVDEWSHITLASVLKLDGDKGICRALRRLQNSIIAFQDRGIAEVLFNSRTQITTEDGVPVEIANTGKVDGKRYLTNKYGCVNKWSIAEGKAAMYFVDNINKAFCATAFDQRGRLSIENISQKHGFSAWFRNNNSLDSWTPKNFENIVTFYDRIHSDVYLVKNDGEEDPCLVYSEMLDAFTSFFDYGSVQMLTNLEDRFISFKNGKLWLQNEGFFCNFFGQQYDFWAMYRVTPDPYGDKIWTNLEYRADFYHTLDDEGNDILGKSQDLVNLDEWDYKENETFDILKVWNEYQTTGESKERPEKKFRIWRYAIPRAAIGATNRFGLDRIRNPWVNVLLKKRYDDDSKSNQDLMQLHDVTAIYFE